MLGVLGLLAAIAMAQDLSNRDFAAGVPRTQTVEGREIILLSSGAGRPANAASQVGAFAVHSHETASRRIHVVSFEGKTYRASTPLDGPWSLVVFDPSRRSFAPLLPSIRVELNDGVDLNAVTEALDAVEVTVLKSLGFAIVALPDGLHPADAVERVQNLNGRPHAAMRLRPPRIQWR